MQCCKLLNTNLGNQFYILLGINDSSDYWSIYARNMFYRMTDMTYDASWIKLRSEMFLECNKPVDEDQLFTKVGWINKCKHEVVACYNRRLQRNVFSITVVGCQFSCHFGCQWLSSWLPLAKHLSIIPLHYYRMPPIMNCCWLGLTDVSQIHGFFLICIINSDIDFPGTTTY